MLEIVGLMVVFPTVNVTAAAIALGWRALGTPVSLYLATEKVWLVPSLLEALYFYTWWRRTGRLDSDRGSGVDRAMRARR